jgi:hypothetical protein
MKDLSNIPATRMKKEIIDINEQTEIDFWRKQFGVTQERLKKAILMAGPKAKDVGSWIKHSTTTRRINNS